MRRHPALPQLHPYWVIAGKNLNDRPTPDHVPDPPRNATTSGRWVDAVDLQPGDILLLKDLGATAVESVALRPANYPVYNFAVQDLKCYAVGLHQVLVHNTHGDEAADAVNAPRTISKIGDLTKQEAAALQNIWKGGPRSQLPLSTREQLAELYSGVASNNPAGSAQSVFNQARADYLLGQGPNPGTNVNDFAALMGLEKFRRP